MPAIYELHINVRIQQITGSYCGAGLSVEETLKINATTFLEMAQILGQFHQLAETLSANKGR